MTKIIEFRNVEMEYKDKKVLKKINFSIGKQEIIGLVGANGAGKTTLMRILVGLTKSYAGKVQSDVKSPKIGCVIESPSFYPYMSGYQNLSHFARYTNSDKKEIVELLELLGLKDAANKKVKAYSLGMRQRLGIAQALLGNPDILVLDEPTNGLDPSGVQDMRNHLNYIVKEKDISVLISSHILSEIEKICDRVMLLKDGVLTEDIHSLINVDENKVEYLFETDTPEVMINYFKSKSFLAKRENKKIVITIDKKKISTIMKELFAANIGFSGVTERAPSLEDQFINIVGGSK